MTSSRKNILLLFLLLTSTVALVRPKVLMAACEDKNYSNPDEYAKAIAECQQEINARSAAQNKNKEDLASLEQNVATTQKLIKSAEAQIKSLESKILDREVKVEYQKDILSNRVRSYYIKSRYLSPFFILLSSGSAGQLTRELTYRRVMTDEDKNVILGVSGEIKQLNSDKDALEKNKVWLVKTKDSVNSQAQTLKIEVDKVEGYFSSVNSKIASLSAKQQALLSARSGTFTSSVGDVPVSSIPCSGPPGSPTYCDPGSGNWFAAFSFGAWTHRKGMSQYGAKGRAENGQSTEQILQAYFGKGPENRDTGGNISVSGIGSVNFEDYYLLGIAEMPSDWPTNALKAQAIAARSYAYRYKSQGQTICTTEACQVFSRSKANNPPSAWRDAVVQTRGMVIDGVTTFYSSTSGGYLTTSGWDTTDGQGGSGFASRAWESKAGSPWFYSSWYTESYSPGSAKCGRGNPWLSEEEMADILNAWQVLSKQGNDDRILPTTINQCQVGSTSGNPYSLSELRDKANSLGGAFTSVSSASVSYSNNGETSSVTFSTNKGSVNISGSEFKQAFNLRAPGFIAIRNVLFNIEKK